jgi:hypothetical protein
MRRTTQLQRTLRETATTVLHYWKQSSTTSTAPLAVREAIADLKSNIAESDENLMGAVERLGIAAGPALGHGGSWLTDALNATLSALNALARQLRYSSIAQDVLQLCDEVRDRAAALEGISEPDRVRLLAALMVVEDATCAIEGYRALPAFAYMDEAYLAKYGLLQALQLGFDAAQAVGEVVGLQLRADRVAGGKVVKITRTLVAGHPLGGSYQGRAWEHFHDRGSAHEKSVLKIMSFDSEDPTNWTGQTQQTFRLMNDGLAVIRELLSRILNNLSEKAKRTRHQNSPLHDQ